LSLSPSLWKCPPVAWAVRRGPIPSSGRYGPLMVASLPPIRPAPNPGRPLGTPGRSRGPATTRRTPPVPAAGGPDVERGKEFRRRVHSVPFAPRPVGAVVHRRESSEGLATQRPYAGAPFSVQGGVPVFPYPRRLEVAFAPSPCRLFRSEVWAR